MKPRTLALEPGALIWESLTLVWELWAPVVEPGTLILKSKTNVDLVGESFNYKFS